MTAKLDDSPKAGAISAVAMDLRPPAPSTSNGHKAAANTSGETLQVG